MKHTRTLLRFFTFSFVFYFYPSSSSGSFCPSSTPSYSSRMASWSPAFSYCSLFFSCSQAVPLTELDFPSLSAFHLYFGDAGFEPRLETGSLTGRASWFSSLPPYTFRTTSLDQATNASFHIPSKSLSINHAIIRRKIFRDIKSVNKLKATP